MGVLSRPSPNFGVRRGGARPDLIVLHHTAMPSASAALDRLCDPDAEVSAHYLIDAEGAVFHLVDEAKRAWHAGEGAWGAVRDVNSRSIGIELANDGESPFAAPQMAALERLLPDIMARWSIRPARVIAHSDMAPGRKQDPGARFDWRRLARQGLSVWPAPRVRSEEHDTDTFAAAARAFGYTATDDPALLLSVVRLRFRPWAAGPADALDLALILDLAERFPVDRESASA